LSQATVYCQRGKRWDVWLRAKVNIMRFDNKSFFSERVELDGNEFRGCTFSRCQLVFRGERMFAFVECLVQNPQWVLEGHAAITLLFLTEAYHKMGESGVRLIEETFNNIRLNKIQPPPKLEK
jgi:hypothetical protein